MRGLWFEAAFCVIRQGKRFSPLKSRAVRLAVRLAGRRGFRKTAVLMLTLRKTETESQWTKQATA